MPLIKCFSTLLLAGLSGLLISGSAGAQGTSETTSSYVEVQKAAEGVDLELVVNGNGSVIGIRIVQCEGCQHTTFLPARNIEIRVGGSRVSVDQALSANGGAGTVLYQPQTRLAEEVIFYGQ